MSTAVTDVKDKKDKKDHKILNPVYEAMKKRALDFMGSLKCFDQAKRHLLRADPQAEMEAARFVMRHLAKRRRLAQTSINGQLAEIKRLAGVTRLWATHDDDDGSGTIGAALGATAEAGRSRSAEAALSDALSCNTAVELVDGPLVVVVARLKQHGVAVNWVRLLIDLEQWEEKGKLIQARWARDFYSHMRSA